MLGLNEGAQAITAMLMLRNKRLRQASLTTAINQIIPVSSMIPIILAYSDDYAAPEASQPTSKTATAASATGFFSGNALNTNASNTTSPAQTASIASQEGRQFFKAKRKTKMNDDSQHTQANTGQGASIAAAARISKNTLR